MSQSLQNPLIHNACTVRFESSVVAGIGHRCLQPRGPVAGHKGWSTTAGCPPLSWLCITVALYLQSIPTRHNPPRYWGNAPFPWRSHRCPNLTGARVDHRWHEESGDYSCHSSWLTSPPHSIFVQSNSTGQIHEVHERHENTAGHLPAVFQEFIPTRAVIDFGSQLSIKFGVQFSIEFEVPK